MILKSVIKKIKMCIIHSLGGYTREELDEHKNECSYIEYQRGQRNMLLHIGEYTRKKLKGYAADEWRDKFIKHLKELETIHI